MRATDILKAIQKLNPAEKHRLREYLIDAPTASSSTGTVLQEISERKQVEISNFEGIVERDGTYFLYSEKGQRKIKDRKPRKRGGSAKKRGISNEQVCVLVARDREKMTFSQT